MTPRKRGVVVLVWILVAALMAITMEPALPTTVDQLARAAVVLLALFLAGVYLFDPWGVASEGPFRTEE